MGKLSTGDAYKQKRGDLRHYAEAVEVCLKASEGDIIHIENYGDISTLTESYEIKDLQSSITLGSYQIWNTLKNWVSSLSVFISYDKLILLTTSPAGTDSDLRNWNTLTKEQKYSALENAMLKGRERVNAGKEKLDLFNAVMNFDKDYTKNDLLMILDKFNISIEAVDSKKKYAELMNLDYFKFTTKKQTLNILNGTIGFIFQRGLEGEDEWEINISELRRTIVQIGNNEKTRIEGLWKKYSEVKIDDFFEAKFVAEINKINLAKEDVEEAIGDYCRTKSIIIDLIDEDGNYQLDIDNCKYKELLRYLTNNKRRQKLDTGDNITNSQKNYYDCLFKMAVLNMELIENTPDFQRGNIHSLVDEEKFYWLIDEN